MTSAREKRIANQFGRPWTMKTTLDDAVLIDKALCMSKTLMSEFGKDGAIEYARNERRDAKDSAFWDEVIRFIGTVEI